MWTSRARSEEGFTLPEILVVILIIGILAAIALPAFAGQTGKGQDASAKSDAAQVASQMEQCHVASGDYRRCDTDAELVATVGSSGATFGNGVGQVRVSAATASGYRVRARSRSGARYRVERASGAALSRTCSPSGTGGCRSDGTW